MLGFDIYSAKINLSNYYRNLTKASYCGFCYRYTRIYCSKDSLYLRNDYSMYTELQNWHVANTKFYGWNYDQNVYLEVILAL